MRAEECGQLDPGASGKAGAADEAAHWNASTEADSWLVMPGARRHAMPRAWGL